VHYDNNGVVVIAKPGSLDDNYRKVPLTDRARLAIHEWMSTAAT
jgi:hypothetical protein